MQNIMLLGGGGGGGGGGVQRSTSHAYRQVYTKARHSGVGRVQ